MAATPEIHRLFETLKKLLKERGLAYADVAKLTGQSTANVKRIFSQGRCSLDQLATLCQSLDLSLEDLVTISGRAAVPTQRLSADQEAFLAKNLDYFAFYRQLGFAKGNVAELRRQSGLSEASARKYLRKLEELKLLERDRDDRAKLPHGYIDAAPGGPLALAIRRAWTLRLVADVVENGGDGREMRVLSTRLAEVHRENLERELGALLDRYREIGYWDQRGASPSLRETTLVVALAPYRLGSRERIAEL